MTAAWFTTSHLWDLAMVEVEAYDVVENSSSFARVVLVAEGITILKYSYH